MKVGKMHDGRGGGFEMALQPTSNPPARSTFAAVTFTRQR
jgi:hypothetical protein